MKFKITGAHKETGDDMELTIIAVTRAEAERVAQSKGMMVSNIETLNDRPILESIPLEPELDLPPAAAAAPAAAPSSGGTAPGAAPPSAGESAPASADTDPAAAARPLEAAHPNADMEYKLLHNQALYLLERTVNKALAEGWEPVGGLTIAIQNNAPNFYQALIWRRKT